jgi:hypothetical protein
VETFNEYGQNHEIQFEINGQTIVIDHLQASHIANALIKAAVEGYSHYAYHVEVKEEKYI